jgi:hypothetical protein
MGNSASTVSMLNSLVGETMEKAVVEYPGACAKKPWDVSPFG